jgi:predicted permease
MTLLSDAALPMMVLVLGMQLERGHLARAPDDGGRSRPAALVATPLAAFGVAHLLGLKGPRFRPAVLQASMPPAVSRRSSRWSSTCRRTS